MPEMAEMGPDSRPGPSFHGPADGLDPLAPSLAWKGGRISGAPAHRPV